MTLPLITDLLTRAAHAPGSAEPRAAGRSAPGCRAAMLSRRPSSCLVAVFVLLAAWLHPGSAQAVSCTTQSQIAAAERSELATAITRMAGYAAAGDTASLRAATLPPVAAQFEGIASSVEALAPDLRGSASTIENLYLLHAADLKAGDDEAQFFCSVAGSPLLVTIAIPQLPPGTYALAIVHAEGVAKPKQLGILVAQTGSGWQLAGFFVRPLTVAGHDGVWYWTRARDLTKAQQRWSAYFYYQSAQFLLSPVDFLSSPNLSKLEREAATVRPDGLPGTEGEASGGSAMTVAAAGQNFAVTQLRTDGALGGLDLVIHYNANAGNVDPVFARGQAIQLMQAMLKQHSELRANFHGLWVYADSPGHQPFAVELPMDQIQ